VKNVDLAKAAEVSGIPADTIKRIAHDFAGAKSGLALAGGAATTGPQATDALIAVNLLNQAVGAVGRTIRFGADSAIGKASPYSEMVKLTKAMAAGEIEVLILADVNPVYAMPPKAGFAEALGKVPMVVSLATRPTETSAGPGCFCPRSILSSHGVTTWLAKASSGSCSRPWGPWPSRASRWKGKAHRRHPALRRTPGPRHRGGQGAAQVGELRGLREGAVAGHGARVRRGQESRSISGRSRSDAAAPGGPPHRRAGARRSSTRAA
jgi:hypothetical protein